MKKAGRGKGKEKAVVFEAAPPTPLPSKSKAWELLQRKKHGPARRERLTELPGGELVTRREMTDAFPGIYGESPDGRKVVMAPDPAAGCVAWQDWPVPCPGCDQTLLGCATDPISGQRHHWSCTYWDRTGREPF